MTVDSCIASTAAFSTHLEDHTSARRGDTCANEHTRRRHLEHSIIGASIEDVRLKGVPPCDPGLKLVRHPRALTNSFANNFMSFICEHHCVAHHSFSNILMSPTNLVVFIHVSVSCENVWERENEWKRAGQRGGARCTGSGL